MFLKRKVYLNSNFKKKNALLLGVARIVGFVQLSGLPVRNIFSLYIKIHSRICIFFSNGCLFKFLLYGFCMSLNRENTGDLCIRV